jgi:hypothetical protein
MVRELLRRQLFLDSHFLLLLLLRLLSSFNQPPGSALIYVSNCFFIASSLKTHFIISSHFAMSNTRLPPVAALDRPEPITTVLARDKEQIQDDCLPCRVIGASAFIGLGVYSYYSGHAQLLAQQKAIAKSASMFGLKSRQTGITGIAATLVGMGLWRLVN